MFKLNEIKKEEWLIGIATAISTYFIFNLISKSRIVTIRNKNPKKILIVGDSQSAIRNLSGENITYTYPNLLKKELEPKGYTIDVLAQGGKPTSWMLQNLPAQLKNNQYDRIYIYGGGNDASNKSIKLENTILNIQKMVELSRLNGADAFVVLGYRIDNFADYTKMPYTTYITDKKQWIPLIERRKELQKRLPKEIKNANFLPVNDLQGKTTDGIHPTASGHQIVAQNFLKSILK